MRVLSPLGTGPARVERTTVAHLDVESAPDTAIQLRAAVDLDIHVGPGEQLALALTRQQAEHLLQDLAARLGRRLVGSRR
ncbi:hypothetical protein LN042_12855 [Kitasatospora sp. RB6PN24]|uniref:hypothetical protein n=1 Tax=Kitasatospora humi TaxID=2893891 RepID=UPI001E634184|nr:hypothetical protein [Kitasatospora humi]MCC9307970.1 hypothetical protein [Kitasatospora humi]